MHTRRRSLVLLLLLVIAATVPTAAKDVRRFEAFFVFSDSLGDTGNDFILTTALGLTPELPPSTSPYRTYFQGRFSNGPILFEHLWVSLNPGGGPVVPSLALTALPQGGAVSFAYGGSTSGATCFPLAGLKCQVEQFAQLLGNRRPPKALYAVFIGANDIIQAENPLDPAVVGGIVANVGDSVKRLYQLGARDVMVFNMPNIGRSLRVTDPFLKAALNGLALQHNAMLAAALANLSSSLPGIRIIPIDMYGFLESLVATSPFNFEVSALPPPLNLCLFEGEPAGIFCADAPTFDVDPTYFFWDLEHPTTSGHAAASAFVLSELQMYFD